MSRKFELLNRVHRPVLSLLLVAALAASTVPALAAPATRVEAQAANLTAGCVKNYSPAVDYFPRKIRVEDATGFTVKYFKNYKEVTVLNPWRGAKEQFKYILVQCGTPAPKGIRNAFVIEVPVKRIIAMSTTHLPHLDKLNVLDRLIGMDTFKYVNNPKVRALVQAGNLIEIGDGPNVSIEKVIASQPDIVMTYGVGDPKYDSHPKLLEAGIPTVINAEYMEGTPLGRSEWIKFTALFFNKEAEAQREYANMKQRYLAIARRVKNVANRPLVLQGTATRDRWRVPGGGSYAARLIADAGGKYLFANNNEAGSLSLTFEEVYARAASADVWLLASFQRFDSIQQLINAEPRYSGMNAVRKGQVWNYDKRLNENGGNDYWETGVANPDLLLADLVKILHPSLLPNHELVFWRQLSSGPTQ
ncbi:MAG: ABC transporter substrate-binding protein [Thermoflexales bacterium]|nr:ABC transporter substrate-binding protein [Thermoflexales bacterium]MCS7323939.1 ABC transporter substrate-binding protein [Thermoflexales bacterium]